MATMTVYVNRNNPSQFAVERPYSDQSDGCTHFEPNAASYMQLRDEYDMDGFVAVEVEIPVPTTRTFKAGDVLRTTDKYHNGLGRITWIRGTGDRWAPHSDTYITLDDAIVTNRLDSVRKEYELI